ncbi:methyltransferase [Pelagibacterium flavum]|uniref:Methyltransferase n=1 Tax=Pelagibacterium flavum TaxID=2984530 RepID=A0ABY6ILK1_9HYPH|nr:methyltransferase [Pelagibacterium sp. YIM 151497]UYQ71470.1 methyltransferase [Pelagibacterium sp. YIM 151497]|tara:strand:+ start:2872 stop:3660 length:789 start_codon:yes stop_codon:yes gene_type:complete
MSVNQPPEFVKRQQPDADAFLGGKLSIAQPEKGFRAGLDSVLLGASLPQGTRQLLDLGAGAGVAALCALAHEEGLEATMVENNAEMAMLAAANVEANSFTHRATILKISATATGAERKALGLGTDSFDVVIANPPYFDAGTHAPDPARAAARHTDGEVSGWVRTAVSCAHAKGEVIFIHVAQALPQLLAAFNSRMGAITVLPIAPRPGMAASRVLVRGRKGSKAPMALLPPLIVHGETGSEYAEPVRSILRGETRLDWQDSK